MRGLIKMLQPTLLSLTRLQQDTDEVSLKDRLRDNFRAFNAFRYSLPRLFRRSPAL